MYLESLAWMADELGYPSWTEGGDGVVRANAAAMRVLPDPSMDLRSVLSAVCGGPLDDALEAALLGAREGERASVEVEGLKLIVAPSADGGVMLVMARNPDELDTLVRRAAAGEMAAGVAHEVANALSSVIGWCSLARNDPGAAPPEIALDRAIQGAEIARDAARQMMAWGSPPGAREDERLDVARTLRDVAALLRPVAIDAGVAIAVDAPDEIFVDGQRADLVSVIWNLAQNAIRALPRGGGLKLAAAMHARRVLVQVVDDGPGMCPEVARKAMQRRFTTNPDGFGLGLPLVLRTVAAMRGTIALETAVGKGCRFTIELPAAQRTTPEAGLPTLKPVGLRGRVRADGLRVLIVDDDPGVRELLRTMLEIQGFVVETADDADTARALGPRCDIALLDMHLESTRGDLLLERLRDSGFHGASAIMSGGDAPTPLSDGGRPDRWLRKPFDPAEFMAHLLDLRGLVRKRRDGVG